MMDDDKKIKMELLKDLMRAMSEETFKKKEEPMEDMDEKGNLIEVTEIAAMPMDDEEEGGDEMPEEMMEEEDEDEGLGSSDFFRRLMEAKKAKKKAAMMG